MQSHSISKNLKALSSQLSSSTANNCTIKVNGETRYPTAREKFTSRMDITSKATSMKEKQSPVTVYLFLMMDLITEEMWPIRSLLERGPLCRSLELCMREIGWGISRKESGRRSSVMAIRTKELLLMGWRKAKGFSNGVMERFMKEPSKRGKWQDRVLSIEAPKKYSQVNLWTIKR